MLLSKVGWLVGEGFKKGDNKCVTEANQFKICILIFKSRNNNNKQ